MKLKIIHLYPDLLNLYGDKGNIETMKHRLVWRGIDAEVIAHTSEDGDINLDGADIVFLGGGTEREEKTVIQKLIPQKDKLIEYVNSGGTLFAVCGGFDMLGKFCEYGSEQVEGLGILDMHTGNGKKRMNGDVIIESEIFDGKIVGFENRAGKTYTNNLKHLGRVLSGGGNNGEDMTEGVVYKNVIGTHLHGPVLPKNPKLCDYILECALRKKYMEFTKLTPLRDDLETKANEFMVNRYIK